MDRLLSAKEVAAIVGYKDLEKARKVIRECIHMEDPLRVSESALQAWINGKSYCPNGEPAKNISDGMMKDFPRRRT